MREFMEVLRASEVFSGIEPDEIEAMLKCLDADTREYARGEFLLNIGDRSERWTAACT